MVPHMAKVHLASCSNKHTHQACCVVETLNIRLLQRYTSHHNLGMTRKYHNTDSRTFAAAEAQSLRRYSTLPPSSESQSMDKERRSLECAGHTRNCGAAEPIDAGLHAYPALSRQRAEIFAMPPLRRKYLAITTQNQDGGVSTMSALQLITMLRHTLGWTTPGVHLIETKLSEIGNAARDSARSYSSFYVLAAATIRLSMLRLGNMLRHRPRLYKKAESILRIVGTLIHYDNPKTPIRIS